MGYLASVQCHSVPSAQCPPVPLLASSQFGSVPFWPRSGSAHKVNLAYILSGQFGPGQFSPLLVNLIGPYFHQFGPHFRKFGPFCLVSLAQVNSAHFLVSLAIWKASEKIEEACAKLSPLPLLVQVKGAANRNTGEMACLFPVFPAYSRHESSKKTQCMESRVYGNSGYLIRKEHTKRSTYTANSKLIAPNITEYLTLLV